MIVHLPIAALKDLESDEAIPDHGSGDTGAHGVPLVDHLDRSVLRDRRQQHLRQPLRRPLRLGRTPRRSGHLRVLGKTTSA